MGFPRSPSLATRRVAWALTEVLLLGDLLPGGERMLGMGSPERALALTKLLTLGSSKKNGASRPRKDLLMGIDGNFGISMGISMEVGMILGECEV